MTIFQCEKCNRENGEDFPPCIFIDTLPNAVKPKKCPYANAWSGKSHEAAWFEVDEMPEGVIE